jgi:uridine phosphorylase
MSTTEQQERMTRDVHLTGKDLMNMVQLRAKDVGKYAIVPGPKERLDSLMKKIENPVKNFAFMEYTMYTGTYQGIGVTAINGGRFAADTAITTEILCNASVQCLIRIGSCGSLTKNINIGDLIVATGAVRGDGVTPYYVDQDFETKPDQKLTDELVQAAKATGMNVHTGQVWSTDAILRETKDVVNKAVDQGAVAVDMVSSVFLTLAQLYKIPAVSILAVSDNVMTGQLGFMNPDYYMAEGSLINVALNLIKAREGK